MGNTSLRPDIYVFITETVWLDMRGGEEFSVSACRFRIFWLLLVNSIGQMTR